MLKGIDVSYYQPNIDFSVLKSQIDFIFIRASYGVGFVDKCFISHRDSARTNNIPCGFYHYAYPQYNSPEAEADFFLQTVGALQDNEILILDFEEKFNGDVVAWCKAFLDKVSVSLNGYKPFIYLNRSTIKSYNWQPVVDAGYNLWLAAYDNDPDFIEFSTPWPNIPIKQYSDSGKVGGVINNVDLNTFYGTIAEFELYGYHKNSVVPENYQTFTQSLTERKFLLPVSASIAALANAAFQINLTQDVLFWIIAPVVALFLADGIVDSYKRSR